MYLLSHVPYRNVIKTHLVTNSSFLINARLSTCAAFGQEEIIPYCTVFSFLLYDDLIWEVREGRWLFERLALKDIGMLLTRFQRVVCLLKSVNISVSEKFCVAYLNAEQLGLR